MFRTVIKKSAKALPDSDLARSVHEADGWQANIKKMKKLGMAALKSAAWIGLLRYVAIQERYSSCC